MVFRIVFRNPNVSAEFKAQMRAKLTRIARASTLGARDAAAEIQRRGALSIARAGRFGARWRQGLRADVHPNSGFQINSTITVHHTEVGANLHEFGGVVKGKPLLWVPLSHAKVTERAKDYPGGLFRVNRKGKQPLLLSSLDREPKYVGLRSVRIKAKWKVRETIRDVMANFGTYYNRHLKD